MKTLYMVRHAKSSWEHNLPDRERPLAKRGLKDVGLMSSHIAKTHPAPEYIWTSDANRAHTTALFFKESFGIDDAHFIVKPSLYDFGGNQVLSTVKECDDSIDHLMIFGHNHAFTSLANMLGTQYLDNLPTCGFVHIDFNVTSWKEIAQGNTKHVLFPKEIRS
ncbi:MAG: histidine phosphatase family protein [Gilvibacter sp.]